MLVGIFASCRTRPMPYRIIILLAIAAGRQAAVVAQFYGGGFGGGGFPGGGGFGVPGPGMGIGPHIHGQPHLPGGHLGHHNQFCDPVLDPFCTPSHRPVLHDPVYIPQQTQQAPPKKKSVMQSKPGLWRLSALRFPGKDSKHMWLVFFHTSNQASSEAKSAVELLAEKVRKNHIYRVGYMDCGENRESKSFCRRRVGSLADLPRFAFVVNGEITMYQETDTPTAVQLHKFATETIPSRELVLSIDSKRDLDDNLLRRSKFRDGAVLLISEKQKTASMYSALAYRFRQHFLFGETHSTSYEVEKTVRVRGFCTTTYPCLLVFLTFANDSNDKVVQYKGPMKGDSIVEWLESVSKTIPARPVMEKDPTTPSDLPAKKSPSRRKVEGVAQQEAKEPNDSSDLPTKQAEDSGAGNEPIEPVSGRQDDDIVSEVVNEICHVQDESIDLGVLDLDVDDEHEDDNSEELGMEGSARDDAKEDPSRKCSIRAGSYGDLDDDHIWAKSALPEITMEFRFRKVVSSAIGKLRAKVASLSLFSLMLKIGVSLLLSCLIFKIFVSRWLGSGWVTEADTLMGQTRGQSQLSMFCDGALYLHHHYLQVATYVAIRTVPAVGVFRGVLEACFRLSPMDGRWAVSTALSFLGDVGGLAHGAFLLLLVLFLDVAVFFVGHLGVAAKDTVERLSCDYLSESHIETFIPAFEMLVVAPLKVLEEASKLLAESIGSGSEVLPESRLEHLFVNFFHHPMGGFPGPGFGQPWNLGMGGFHGYPSWPLHHGFHPMVHHHYQHQPIVEIIHNTKNEELEKEVIAQLQLLQDLVTLALYLVSILVVAPVLEEFLFRHCFHCLRRLIETCCKRFCGSVIQTNVSWHRAWIFVASLFFAAAHLNNHLPSGEVHGLLRDKGSEYLIHQLTMATIQFCVTFFLGLRLFVPVYEKLGLSGAIGSHFLWNACALHIHYQIPLRLVLAGVGYLAYHFGRGLLQVRRQRQSAHREAETEKSPASELEQRAAEDVSV